MKLQLWDIAGQASENETRSCARSLLKTRFGGGGGVKVYYFAVCYDIIAAAGNCRQLVCVCRGGQHLSLLFCGATFSVRIVSAVLFDKIVLQARFYGRLVPVIVCGVMKSYR